MKWISVEIIFYLVILSLSLIAVLVPLSIVGYLILNGIRVVDWAFLTEFPRQLGKEGGIFPTIIASFIVTTLSILISIPLGISAAVYLSEYAYQKYHSNILHLGINILAGIPSILFGMVGYLLFVVALRFKWSILSGSLTLAFMLMPTITKITVEAFCTIPDEYRDEAVLIGATKWNYLIRIGIPLIAHSIIASIALSIGRAYGETAALILTVGSALKIPWSLFDSARPMSIHILLLAKEGISLEKAFGISLVLLLIVSVMNVVAIWLMRMRTDIIIIGSG